MKSLPALLSLVLASAATLIAAPLTETTPVYASPDTAGAPIATLKAGTEPVNAAGVTAPAGWTAVSLPGPHDVYAANKDVTKSLEVRVGAPYLLEPKTDSAILALAGKDDATEIIDYRGKWTKFRLTSAVTGYIKAPVKIALPVSSAPVVAPAIPTASAPESPEPVAVTAIGRAAPVGDGGSSALPRLFQGTLASTYNPLRPRRPYDYQLNDDAGTRYAYIDVSKLLVTERISKYLDRTVVIYGTAQAVPGSKDMVVVAESLQLR
jgi:hypothetical protein